MGGQTDSQVGSQQFALPRTCKWWLVINLCRLVLSGQTVKNVRPNLSSTKVNANQRKYRQVVENLRRPASPFAAICSTGSSLAFLKRSLRRLTTKSFWEIWDNWKQFWQLISLFHTFLTTFSESPPLSVHMVTTDSDRQPSRRYGEEQET